MEKFGSTPPPPAGASPGALVEHFFRHETARLHGALVRVLGVDRLSLAEDVAQEAMLRALRAWSMGGVPANPSAWITQVAMNLARDAARHGRMATGKEDAIVRHHEQMIPSPAAAWEAGREFRDDALRLMFVCCHPSIAPDAQVVLALKVLGGFGTGEIARAFFATEAAIEKQLTRTKQRLQESGAGFEIPEGENLAPRLRGVHATLYLLFNEGYKASSGEQLLREELCHEAIRLATLLVEHPAGRTPRSHALLALMLLNAARFPARTAADGTLLRLDEQDRSKWNRALIDRGLQALAAAAQGGEISEYHLQAGIAALHCTAPDYGSTNWERILQHYDRLVALQPSPVVALNRAVALAQVRGPEVALAELAALPGRAKLESHHLLHAVEGELRRQAGHSAAAAESFRRALALARVGPERTHLARLLDRASTQSLAEVSGAPDETELLFPN